MIPQFYGPQVQGKFRKSEFMKKNIILGERFEFKRPQTFNANLKLSLALNYLF